ncbi:hypothetical protein K8I61_05810 [bacterium]|nr:hypothetical protein [bacterium]
MGKLVKVLLAVSLGVLLATSAFAAESSYDQGTWFLSGGSNLDLAFGSDTMTPEKGPDATTDVTEFGLGTRVGYFVIDGLEIGLGLDFDYTQMTDDADNVTTVTDFLIGLQGAYFIDLSGYVDPFVAILFGFASESTDFAPDTGTDTTDSASGFGYRGDLGINIAVARTVGIAPSIFYRGESLSGTADVVTTTVDPTTGAETTTTAEADYDTTSGRFGLGVAINVFLN